MSKAEYAEAYKTYGESLMGYGFSKQFKPASMSNAEWRGAAGNAWRNSAIRAHGVTYSTRGGDRRRHRTKRRRVKRSTRRR